jgi:GAF domain-containing protein
MSEDPRASALHALSQLLVANVSLGDTLLRVAQLTTDALPGARMAGVSMLSELGKPTTAIFTDEESPEIDQAQYTSGVGPCLQAWRTQQVVRIDDMTTADSDYPEFARAARDHGVLSTLSLPLVAAGQGVGALNLYSNDPHAFSEDDEELGSELAGAASIVLSNAAAYWGAFTLGEQLQEAMHSRATIEQAKGMLMSQSPTMTPDEAFDVLRRASQRENVKLREIAQRLVDRQPMISEEGTG